MQPAKPLAASKKAALASVTCDRQPEQVGRRRPSPRRGGLAGVEQLDRPPRPDRPVAEQAADEPTLDPPAADPEAEGREQIEDDVSSLPV